MLVEEVRKLPPLERFIYWIKERHTIYIKRKNGQSKPWTDDTILQSNFFTNPYRENDKTTVWFRENIRDKIRDRPEVLLATIIYRWFNWIPTAKELLFYNGWSESGENLFLYWDTLRASERLSKLSQVFTGAFVIAGSKGETKVNSTCRRIDQIWNDQKNLLLKARHWNSQGMQSAHQELKRYEGLGGFMAYEIVTDLRYTYFLEQAPDKLTWCNPGPGAIRGMYRLLGLEFTKGENNKSLPVPENWTEKIIWLLDSTRTKLSKMPTFEMREIEHSLCEWDKYERVLWGDGRSKRKYAGK